MDYDKIVETAKSFLWNGNNKTPPDGKYKSIDDCLDVVLLLDEFDVNKDMDKLIKAEKELSKLYGE